MIRTFRDARTERLWNRQRVREFEKIAAVALRRLTALDGAQVLTDLLIPPGNRLEPLQGDRQGQRSIRINDQYRICFTWREDRAHDVEITKHYKKEVEAAAGPSRRDLEGNVGRSRPQHEPPGSGDPRSCEPHQRNCLRGPSHHRRNCSPPRTLLRNHTRLLDEHAGTVRPRNRARRMGIPHSIRSTAAKCRLALHSLPEPPRYPKRLWAK